MLLAQLLQRSVECFVLAQLLSNQLLTVKYGYGWCSLSTPPYPVDKNKPGLEAYVARHLFSFRAIYS